MNTNKTEILDFSKKENSTIPLSKYLNPLTEMRKKERQDRERKKTLYAN